jgi:arabinose-5-phosphate isomerase
LRWGREIVHHEGTALIQLADSLGESFTQAVDLIQNCRGNVVVSGMGKAGLVGQKISATLCSTGTPSIFLHPAEAIHGDLGRLQSGDIVLMLSQSGETDEVVRLLPALDGFNLPIVSITASASNTLGKSSTVTLELGKLQEAGANRLAPSTSTTVMMALGDALALVVSRLRGFGPEHFARFHPGGSLGLKLAIVDDVMRPLAECRVALDSHRVRDVFVEASRPGRRSGAIMLHDTDGRLTGIFTDSDLARLLEHRQDSALDASIHSVMTAAPTTITLGTPLPKAVDLLAERKFSELPIVDGQGKPAGMLDITDVVALLPHEPAATEETEDDGPTTIPFGK